MQGRGNVIQKERKRKQAQIDFAQYTKVMLIVDSTGEIFLFFVFFGEGGFF